ncbi:MAG: hypothetical protein JNN00_19000 [Chitinophagaceae bacterium]|nr:hypothetical protein [Chitinophagaceae bacterium]
MSEHLCNLCYRTGMIRIGKAHDYSHGKQKEVPAPRDGSEHCAAWVIFVH